MLSGTVHSSAFSRKLTKTKYENYFIVFFSSLFSALFSRFFHSMKHFCWRCTIQHAQHIYLCIQIHCQRCVVLLYYSIWWCCVPVRSSLACSVPFTFVELYNTQILAVVFHSTMAFYVIRCGCCFEWLAHDVPMEARSNAPLASARVWSSRFCPPNHASFLHDVRYQYTIGRSLVNEKGRESPHTG